MGIKNDLHKKIYCHQLTGMDAIDQPWNVDPIDSSLLFLLRMISSLGIDGRMMIFYFKLIFLNCLRLALYTKLVSSDRAATAWGLVFTAPYVYVSPSFVSRLPIVS